MRVSKEFKAGLLVVLAIAGLIAGVNYLKGKNVFGKNRTYYVVYDNAQMIDDASSIFVSGVKVGQVASVQLHPDSANKVVVGFEITNPNVNIPEGSIARLVSADVLGTKAINLEMNFASIDYHDEGDTLIGEVDPTLGEQVSEELLPVKKKVEELLGTIDDILISIMGFWDTSASYTVDQGLQDVREGIQKFGDLANDVQVFVRQTTEKTSKTFDNIQVFSAMMKDNSERLDSIIHNVNTLTADLAKTDISGTVASIKSSIDQIDSVLLAVNNKEGTLGKLIYDKELYDNLAETSKNLDYLLQDLAAYPERYLNISVFGRKQKGLILTKPEEDKLKNHLDSLPDPPSPN